MRKPSRTAQLLLAATLLFAAAPPLGAQQPEILPLDQVKPGMKGVAYTIFAGDKIETMEVEVIGTLPNLLGPKQHIILVQLKGSNVEYTGVAGGMSGSPVYLEGKLAGALSLRFGLFAKQPLAGATPIENILDAAQPDTTQKAAGTPEKDSTPGSQRTARAQGEPREDAGAVAQNFGRAQYPLPEELRARSGLASDAFLSPIEAPLVFSGLLTETLARFRDQLSANGLVATHGGTTPPRPDDAELKPGDMVGMVLMQGDLSLQAGCTVTAVVGDQVYVCGHPLLGYGATEMPMTRGRVLTTLSSAMASVKVMTSAGVIGTITQDRLTAVLGRLGPAPKLIPVELRLRTPAREKQFRFEVMDHPKLTPLLVAIATFNGLVANTAYSEGMTFQLNGSIAVSGHPPVLLENMFAPTDQAIPDGFFVALAVQSIFARIYTNPYERARIEKVTLEVESIPERRLAAIESAWSDKSEVTPGETLNVKVLLRPYRGAPVMREMPITIPAQVPRGPLRILVSDSDSLNRLSRFFTFSPQSRLPGLAQLITLLNRERRNNRLYVTLLQPTPTLLVEEKELPNAPVSQINVLDQRRTGGSSLLLRESIAGEWSLPMNQVISGQHTITITVR